MTKSSSAASRRSLMPAGSVALSSALTRGTRNIIPNPAMPTRRTGALAINPKR